MNSPSNRHMHMKPSVLESLRRQNRCLLRRLASSSIGERCLRLGKRFNFHHAISKFGSFIFCLNVYTVDMCTRVSEVRKSGVYVDVRPEAAISSATAPARPTPDRTKRAEQRPPSETKPHSTLPGQTKTSGWK